jgi:hypothetical protein
MERGRPNSTVGPGLGFTHPVWGSDRWQALILAARDEHTFITTLLKNGAQPSGLARQSGCRKDKPETLEPQKGAKSSATY